MADELTMTTSLAIEKDVITGIKRDNEGFRDDMSGDQYTQVIQNTSATAAPMELGDVADPHWVHAKVIGASAVEISLDPSGVPAFSTIPIGKSNLISMTQGAVYHLISASDSQVELLISER